MANSCSFFLGEVMPRCKDTQTAYGDILMIIGLNLLAENQRRTWSFTKNQRYEPPWCIPSPNLAFR